MSSPHAGSPASKPGLLGRLFGGGSGSGTAKAADRRPSVGQGAVFGVALHESLKYASVAISQVGEDGKARIYGHIPVIVAKAGLFLKEHGTTTPGIFRVSGSNKRIKELEQIFDAPPTYGKDLAWDAYSVHDAASAFRRYLNMLPLPIVPFELYGAFQDALPRSPSPPLRAQVETAIDRYRQLINSLPPSSQHIFFYTLDLLSVFHRNSEANLMPASNLATIFQPGLLRHPPVHTEPAPEPPVDADAVRAQVEADALEHRRSQEVLVFLIEHQDAFELELPRNLRRQQQQQQQQPGPSLSSSSSPPMQQGGGGASARSVASTGTSQRSAGGRTGRRRSAETPASSASRSPSSPTGVPPTRKRG